MERKEKIAIMRKMREGGMPYSRIGKVFGISRQRVHQILKGGQAIGAGQPPANNKGEKEAAG